MERELASITVSDSVGSNDLESSYPCNQRILPSQELFEEEEELLFC